MRVSSTLAGMEMLATGTTCSLNHSVTTTTPDLVAASIEPQRDLGIRQVYAKELRCRTPGNPRHPLEPRRGAGGVRGGGPPLERRGRRARALRHGDRIQRPLGRRRHEHGGADLPRLRARREARPAYQRAYRRRHVLARNGLSEVPAGDRPHRRALSDAARHPRSALDPDPLHPLHRARHRAHGAGRREPGLHADQRVDPRRRHRTGRRTRSAPASQSRSAPTDRWSTIRSTWSSR